jgi:hypothetical protein
VGLELRTEGLLQGEAGGAGPGGHFQLGENVRDVVLDRPHAEAKGACDLGVALAFDEEVQDF